MDRLRSVFNSMLKNERYSRFTLQRAEDGEKHVEITLDDATDDGRDVDGQAGGSPTFTPAPQHRSSHKICCVALGFMLIFVIGYLIGFVSHRKPRVEPGNCDTGHHQSDIKTELETTPDDFEPTPEPQMDWTDITQVLTQKLTSQNFEKTLKDFDLPRRSAGSEEDSALANHIFKGFQKLNMDPWTDIHYVQLQTPDSERPNQVTFGSNVFKPKGYLAYSATGKVQGKLVYGNYGRQEDLDFVQQKNIELKGCVLLLRCGKISFAEQVNNAATKGASAVLIYPDAEDYSYRADTALYGHVHMGSGDPYTPGFPSFNHTQFPPTQSSGLPKIPAQTITANESSTLLQNIGGPEPDGNSDFIGGFQSNSYRLGGTKNITVEVNNMLVNRELHNVFGVIKGFIDSDRYIVLGAQRDAWSNGYARAAVGTSVLMELAKAVHEMVEKDGFRPRRSLVFASWSAGEYGSVGATEWLEGYMSSIDKRVFAYINLDGVVMGRGSFMASASPMLYSLIESTMKGVSNPLGSGSLYDMMGKNGWETNVMRPMTVDDPAYPFLAFSGIPSISFHFISLNTESYPYYGTELDTVDHLNYETNNQTSEITAVAAQFAGQMAVRLVHDHLLRLDVSRYSRIITSSVHKVYKRINQLLQSGQLKNMSPHWLAQARGSYEQAARHINTAIINTDLSDMVATRTLNDRIMGVEHGLLSPYVSPVETPYRHLLLGRGSHTLASIAETADLEHLRIQLALATWNLQGCANSMVGDIWDIDNEI